MTNIFVGIVEYILIYMNYEIFQNKTSLVYKMEDQNSIGTIFSYKTIFELLTNKRVFA